MKKFNVKCRCCGEFIEDLEECKTGQYWTNDGDRVIFHICPECGESIEEFHFS